MQNSFVKGMMIGGVLVASVSMAMNSDMMNAKTKRRMARSGKSFLRKSSNIIGDVADIFR